MNTSYVFWPFCTVILLLSPLSAVAFSEADVKDVLQETLLVFFEDPKQSVLKLPQLKDLLVFYLTIPEEQEEVDLSEMGNFSGQPIGEIIEEATGNDVWEDVPTNNCTAGWKCTSSFNRAYQFANCSIGPNSLCNNGCSNGECNLLENTSTTNCTAGWICTFSAYKAYQSANCSVGPSSICDYGCSNGECNSATDYINCLDYGADFQCVNYTEWVTVCNSSYDVVELAPGCDTGGTGFGYCSRCP